FGASVFGICEKQYADAEAIKVMKIKQFRKMLWRCRRNLAAAIDPTVYSSGMVRSSRREPGRDSEMATEQASRDESFALFSDPQAARGQAEGLWEQNKKTEARQLLRRALRQFPCDTLLWMAYGNRLDRKSTRLNSSHVSISYAVFCLK